MLTMEPTTPARNRVVFVLAILGGMVSLPYLFPSPLSISRSYVVGFSNRAAIILLLIGTALLAVYTRGKVSRTETKDSTLGWPVLLIALIGTFFYCVHRCGTSTPVLPGVDATYLMNRVQLLSAGLVPYRHFEFAYGPLLLYSILWVQKLLHVSPIRAFDLVWITFWELGVAMVWAVVRGIDLPIRARSLLFGFLVVTQVVFATYGSLSYSPFRTYLSAFCIVVSYSFWKRFRKPWLLVLCTMFSLALTICCSMDQAVGVACGLLVFLCSLALPYNKELSWRTVLFAFAGILGSFAYAEHLRLTEPLHSFGGGGYSYPVLPSFGIFAALFAYIVAGCVLYRFLYLSYFQAKHKRPVDCRETGALVLPLVVAGYSMLPNALGRCDILHITAATPAFVIGVAVICSMPSVRLWWSPLAFVGLICFPRYADTIINQALPRLHVHRVLTADPALTAQGFTVPMSDDQWYSSPSHLTARQLPCDRQYFSPSFMPVPTEPFLPQCLDTGYYLGFTNVTTPKTIEYKVEELRKHSAQPLLMENSPLEAQLPRQQAFADGLYQASATFWVPKERRAPLTYSPIIRYIREHYVPGPIVANGLLQVWYPAAQAIPTSPTPSSESQGH